MGLAGWWGSGEGLLVCSRAVWRGLLFFFFFFCYSSFLAEWGFDKACVGV